MRPIAMAVLAGGLLAAGATAQIPSGSIEVEVRERDGGALAGELVSIALDDPSSINQRRGLWRSVDRARTDQAGRAGFTGLIPGRYAILLERPSRPYLVSSEENPHTPPLRVTVLPGDRAPQRVTVELWRGISVTAELRVSDGRYERFQVRYRHRQTGRTFVASPRGSPWIERRLVPGSWVLAVEPPGGYLLTAVEHNGREAERHEVPIDLVADPGSHYLTWTYVAPARLEGTIEIEGGGLAGVEVVATLVEPGPWIDVARRLGGSRFERVTATSHPPTGRYEMVLPDGGWRVAPAEQGALESEPPERLVELVPGGTGRADFTVRSRGERLEVRVRRPDSRMVEDARVAVFAHAADGRTAGDALATGRAGDSGTVTLPALEPGRYRLVAAHPDFLEGETVLEIRAGEPQNGTVTLRAGAEVRVEARDGERPLTAVEVIVARVGDEPPGTVADAEIRAARLRRTVVTDLSGRGMIGGLYPGDYRLTARLLAGDGLADRVVLATVAEDFAPALELRLGETEHVTVRARRMGASSLSLVAVCDDGAPPPLVAVRVVPAGRAAVFAGDDGAARLATATEPELELARDDLPFTGPGHDALRVGPLAPGVYHLALRPRGFDRWTWAFAADDPAAADRIQVLDGGAATDLGTFPLECAPAIDLEPEILSGAPLPDLRQAKVTARVLDAAPDGAAEDRELARPEVELDDDRVRLRLLPTGRWRLVFSLEHPHFLPRPELAFEAPLEMERGEFQIGTPQIADVGGAIRVRGAGALVRVHGADGPSREATATPAGPTLVPSLIPGSYRVELCADVACAEPLARWDDVAVRRGETVELRYP